MSVEPRTWIDTRTGEPRERLMIELRWRYPDGRKPVFVRKVAQVQTKGGAEREERQILKALMDGTYGRKAVKEVPTLKAFSKDFLSGHVALNNKPSTECSREGEVRRYLLPAFGSLRLDEISVAEIERFKVDLTARKLSPKTINNALGTLRKLLRYAEDLELIGRVPRIRPLPVTKPDVVFLEPAALTRLLDAASYNHEWRDMILFNARTGLRFGELSELRWADVNLEAATIRVSRSVWRGKVTDRKNHEIVTVPLSPDALEVLTRRRAALKQARDFKRSKRDALVFCKPDGGRHIHRRADVALKRCCDKAKAPRIGWHKLRHTFAAGLANAQRPLLEIKELCGHRDIKSTLVYTHLTDGTKADAVAALDAYNRVAVVQGTCKGGH
jgi:integrase